MLSSRDRVVQLKLNHVFKIFHDLSPDYLKLHFTRVSSLHKYSTRGSPFNFVVPSSKGQARFTFYNTAIHHWNSLPGMIKNTNNFSLFKKLVKKHLASYDSIWFLSWSHCFVLVLCFMCFWRFVLHSCVFYLYLKFCFCFLCLSMLVKDPNGNKLLFKAFWAILGTLVDIYILCLCYSIYLVQYNYVYVFFYMFVFKMFYLCIYNAEYPINSINQSINIFDFVRWW